MAGKLRVVDGRLKGPASITYNNPWPCPNGQLGMRVPHGVMGVVMHTMVGNLPGTTNVFNNGGYQASAHFGIDQNGHIHQYGPVNGWVAWAEEAGNENWYSIEHADNGNPNNPLTDAQLTASAQVVEALSAFASFPLREANSTTERGYGVHFMGGAAWGGHTCPDLPPRHVRSHQRPEILRRAGVIRQGQHEPPAPQPAPQPAPAPGALVTDGTMGLSAFAAQNGVQASDMLAATAEASATGEYVSALATYVNTVFGTDTANMPDNLLWYYRQKSPTGQWADNTWQTGAANHPQDPQPLSSLAALLGTDAQSIVSLTAENSQGGVYPAAQAGYVNGVFSRSQALLPAGLTLGV
jgi:hypothetical protein